MLFRLAIFPRDTTTQRMPSWCARVACMKCQQSTRMPIPRAGLASWLEHSLAGSKLPIPYSGTVTAHANGRLWKAHTITLHARVVRAACIGRQTRVSLCVCLASIAISPGFGQIAHTRLLLACWKQLCHGVRASALSALDSNATGRRFSVQVAYPM